MNTKGFLEDLKAAMVKNGVYWISGTFDDDLTINDESYAESETFDCGIRLDEIDKLIEIYTPKEAPADTITFHYASYEFEKGLSYIDTFAVCKEDIVNIERDADQYNIYSVVTFNKNGSVHTLHTRDKYEDAIKLWKGGKE